MEDDIFQEVKGSGKGGLSVVTGIPLQDKDNFCRSQVCCFQGGCLGAFAVFPAQFLFFKINTSKKLEIVTGIPLVDQENFCNVKCCCVEELCVPFEMACQIYCLRCCGDGPK